MHENGVVALHFEFFFLHFRSKYLLMSKAIKRVNIISIALLFTLFQQFVFSLIYALYK